MARSEISQAVEIAYPASWWLTCIRTCGQKTMSERNLLTALIVLLLPLSFGLDPRPGTKTAEITGTGYFSTANVAPLVTLETALGKPAARRSTIPIDFAAIYMRPQEDTGIFESSFDLNVPHDVTCERSTNTTNDLEVYPANENCCCTGFPRESANRSAVSFPMEESFVGSDSSEDNRTHGNGIPIGPGRRSPSAPIPAAEPGSLAMLACGIIAVAGIARRRFVRTRPDSRLA